jgi:GxxExxY protein
MEPNEISGQILDAALKVHKTLGPGLLESVYRACLTHELRSRGLRVRTEISMPVIPGGVRIDAGDHIDMLVEETVVVELKAVEKVIPVHEYQTLTYLRLSGHHLGLLLNFNVSQLRNGIRRIVNNL